MLQHVKDLGTPIKIGLPVSLTIDGRPVTVATGTSVMHAAALAGIAVPKLCATDSLEAFGSCRVCLVEIEGRKGYPASCTTEVEEGMEVRTRSERLDDLRRNVVELYVSDHPLDCDSCSANGECELQDVAASLGVEESRYGPGKGGYRDVGKDSSNPYFSFDPAQCIVCYRCVRACDDIQGTFALTVDGRGYASRVTAGQNESFMDSDCVSCGACVNHCPTEALIEKSVVEQGLPDRRVTTTCAYCGVGCSFHAELQGDQVLRMTPDKAGQANEGHACVKGRFAFGYATHHDRITRPMIRDSIDEPWREVSWDEAFDYTAGRLRAIQQQYGPDSIGGITSSRCTNEETYLVQKMVRAAFGNNNVDTCARVCHSPTGYGLKTTLGESAGTQAFHSVAHADVIMVMGANPSDAHPVFASRLKRRLREGARLIVVDPRRIELVGSPHIRADHHLALRPGSNVAFINAMAHVVVTEGLEDRGFIEDRCEEEPYRKWREFIATEQNSPEATERITGIPAAELRAAARLFAGAPNAAIYYGLGVSEHSQGSTTVMGIANLAMATGNLGREGVGVNPLRGQNNVQGSCDGLPAHFGPCRSQPVRGGVGRGAQERARAEDPEHVRCLHGGPFQGTVRAGRGRGAERPEYPARRGGAARPGVPGRAGPVPERDGPLRPRVPARYLVSRKGRHLHERRAPHFQGAHGHRAAARSRGLGSHDGPEPGAGLPDGVSASLGNHGRDRAPDADLRRRELRETGPAGQHPVALRRHRPRGNADDARRPVCPGQRLFCDHRLRADRRGRHAPVPTPPDYRPDSLAVQRRRPDAPHAELRVLQRGRARDPSF
jgi:formylmethanofuran dehydrogenase subunit B/aerobic-type carbon monoxide dehydrogenase small subunit (CoxS/CutS family)